MPTSLNYGITSKAMTLIVLFGGMSKTSTYSDQITLEAIADLFAVNVQVVLPSGVNNNCNTIQLGYLPEGHGDHYESILGNPNVKPADESAEFLRKTITKAHYGILMQNPLMNSIYIIYGRLYLFSTFLSMA